MIEIFETWFASGLSIVIGILFVIAACEHYHELLIIGKRISWQAESSRLIGWVGIFLIINGTPIVCVLNRLPSICPLYGSPIHCYLGPLIIGLRDIIIISAIVFVQWIYFVSKDFRILKR